ncbi:hypothetical protein IW148_002121 [Coemansia sp. RSA 1199]|nr:hypothetical protein IW148_002121 [Coemansia sp. RSA 1199]
MTNNSSELQGADSSLGMYTEEEARTAISALALANNQGAEPVTDNQGEAVDDEDDSLLFAPLTQSEVDNCAFSSWYPNFSRVTFKSEIIRPLDPEFIKYLLSDGVFVPGQKPMEYHGELEEFGSSNGSDWSDSDDDNDGNVIEDISSTTAEISRRIELLGGSAFPRTTWSAPTDADWASNTGTLQCKTPQDVYWLLKASNKIAKDLTHERYSGQPATAEPELVLREWANLHPSMVFRCFVRNNVLVGISQVDVQFHKFLNEMSSDIELKLTKFFAAHATKFLSSSFCYDVYVARTVDRVLVMDFEPWSHDVDSCLFEWRELCTTTEFLGLRLFPEGVNPLGHFSAKYSSSRFPIEMTADAYHASVATIIERMKAEQN